MAEVPLVFEITSATEADIPEIARINSVVFTGNRDNLKAAEAWIAGWFPCVHYHFFVAKSEGKIIGYVSWQIHGGNLRASPSVELEQLGIDPPFEGKGVGSRLTSETMDEMMRRVVSIDNRIEDNVYFFVWCYIGNFGAMATYMKSFEESAGWRKQYGDRVEVMYRHRVPRFKFPKK